ncbi:VTC domain-containing protein [Patescibacteria group bacterium]|nr:VTC domain-containing protein [Patescibacteria group bacterium]MBU0963691.1 VTC domain-containing protein [Patescibacteria group bacterium]
MNLLSITQLLKDNDYQYERKFYLPGFSREEIIAMVNSHPAIFTEIFYRRKVNNIYFDSFNMKSYFDNLDGVSNRLKVRIRWYGNNLGFIEKPILELKVKNNYLRGKIQFPLPSFSINNNFSIVTIKKIFREAKIPEFLKIELQSLDLAIFNYYNREYFLSENKNFRFTIDDNMKFHRLNNLHNNFFDSFSNYKDVVLELKYSQENDDFAASITNNLPFRITKSSKYVMGVERLVNL